MPASGTKSGSPAVATIFDTHNAFLEETPHSRAIRKHFPLIRHVHVNEMDGRRPGTGTYDFATVLGTLRDLGYRGWVSVEVFDFSPGGERIAKESLAHLERAANG